MAVQADDFIPRPYQLELLQVAKEQNTIVYLPTGSGKTFIAVMLIKELSADIRRPYDDGGKHTLFIVNTVPLITQQSAYIRRLTGLSCQGLSGDSGIDFWQQADWDVALRSYQVFVMTAQILVNALCHGYIHLNRINLIIFDECHRAVSDHPMRQIMQSFEHCPKDEQPKVLGLSAVLLNANIKLANIESAIQTLEVTFQAKLITTDIGSKSYEASPIENVVVFDKYIVPDVGQRVINILMEVKSTVKLLNLNSSLSDIESSIEFRTKSMTKRLRSIANDIQEQVSDTGIYGASKCALLHLIELECIKKCKKDKTVVHALEYVITEVTKCRKLMEDEMEGTELRKIQSYASDQVLKLCNILKNFNSNMSKDQKFCCIVFVQRRYTARVIFHILKTLSEYDEEYKFLKPDSILGYSRQEFQDLKEWLCVSKWNNNTMYSFRNGITNCIVATDVVDEGIDVPTCGLIVRYNFPADVRAYIQSKGRARYKSSQYTLLIAQHDLAALLKRYQYLKAIEGYLKELLLLRTHERLTPPQDKIEEQLYTYEIPPYVVIGTDGQKCYLSEPNVVSLINMYCMSLLKSKFIRLSPVWVLHKNQECIGSIATTVYKVSLKLPAACPFKSVITGDTMRSINGAKRSAAMKMCIELHKIGELSDKLLPQTADSLQERVSDLFPNWINEDTQDGAMLPGTYKKKRLHSLQFPSVLYGAFPFPNRVLYIHLLHVKPLYSTPHDNRHLIFYNLLHSDAGFCILSTKEMPEISSFPIFMSAGELSVDVKVNYSKITLSELEIRQIKTFHTLIFNEVVPVIKSFMVFDNYNRDNCFLVAPVDEHLCINWEVITQYRHIKRIPPPADLHFKSKDYELALVMPNYRASADVYIVTQVCEDITPNSCFPTDNFFSYVHYYKEKHGLSIKNIMQPLLEVKSISRKVGNYIIPRHKQTEIKKRKHKDFQEHLVPELCIRIEFPALYWLKATLLPSILHRLSQLLVAEDLRQTIAVDAGLGLVSGNNKWSPLIITDEIEEELSEQQILELSSGESSMENDDALQPEIPSIDPEVDVFNTDGRHYPWAKHEEPPDIYRHIDKVQLIQIEHYCQFMYEQHDDLDNTVEMLQKNAEVSFKDRLSVPAPPLHVLTIEKSDGPDHVHIMHALTTKAANDAFNLERLETLGDSYLKFITSAYLYFTFPQYTEGSLSMLKGKIIGNRNLCYCGMKRNIPGRMKVDDFVPLSNFIPPAYGVFRQLQSVLLDAEVSPNVLYEIQIPEKEQFEGYITESTKVAMESKVLNWETAETQTGMEHYLGVQTVPDKTIADCVEALIGVYLESMGIKNTIALLQWFEILPNEIDCDLLLHGKLELKNIPDARIGRLMPWQAYIESKIGYKFNNKALLLQAFTHPSYTENDVTEGYQKLEFLGDAILDFLITSHIYKYCGNLNPGALTDLRSALVNNITLACLSVRHGLHTALLCYAPDLNKIIDRFVRFQEERNHAVDDELLWILLEEEHCNMAEYVDVPKVLGDIYESLIGAIYLDCNKNLTTVWSVIYGFMHNEIDQFSKNIPKQPVRVLHEIQGAKPQFLKPVEVGSDTVMVPLKVTIDGTVKLFHGFGANKKQAKCASAKQALKRLLQR